VFAPTGAHREYRAFAGRARHADVAAHHARELAARAAQRATLSHFATDGARGALQTHTKNSVF
jgi:hypothetical protein